MKAEFYSFASWAARRDKKKLAEPIALLKLRS
jgi:hypothetical protein